MWQDKGFIQDGSTDTSAAMLRLETLISFVKEKYQSLPSDELLKAPAPGKWSKQQVLGHLVDSVINNLKRFTDAQLQEQPYTIIAYQQDGLMQVNAYQKLPLQHLLNLWQSLNQQIVYVVRNMPADKLAYKVQPQYNQTGNQTLAWLICDYVAHMEHHLRSMSFIH